ncbi:hypothetical protein QAD02_003767 [Eretmocerus hayati]|uniref:Uncharacterized protein n=1 Tax=Eretmocerus hayati TaxID=131215 RepID=A0ACC2NNR1_9HYME|nr:hypothetical protein QAD02_003767 [Eretmocerus hayati]
MGTTQATAVAIGMPKLHRESALSFLDAQRDDSNRSLDMQQMSEILQGFYDDFNNQTNYLLIALYVPVIVLAMAANLMVIIVVFKYHYMRSVTNYFVVNLSLADLLVTVICMPMAVSQAVSIIWVYGEMMCKLFFYLQGVAVAASVFTITAMSVDRFLAIRNPIDFRKIFNRKSTKIVIAALWIIALVIFSPILIAATLQSPITDLDNITLAGHWAREDNLKMPKPPTFYVCSEDFKPLGIHAHIFGAACFILVYAIPGCIVIIMYSMMGRTLCARRPPFDCDSMEGSASSQQGFRLVRERRRVAWILLLLAVLFALCWLPYNVLRLLIDFGVLSQRRIISDVLSYCLFLGHANSALNPIVYCFMTRNFRRSVAEILCRNMYGSTQRRPHRKSLGSAAGNCGGCNSVPERNSDPHRLKTYRGGSGHVVLSSSRIPFVPNRGGSNPMPETTMPAAAPAPSHRSHTTQPPMRTSTSASSSGYDSYCSRHSPHQYCFMLQSQPQGHAWDDREHQIKVISPAKGYSIDKAFCVGSNKNPGHCRGHSSSSRSSSTSSQSRLFRFQWSSRFSRKDSANSASGDQKFI